ncbi:MAG: hypothetical protein WCW14_04660 [Candidatus Paceibacterota bacterium]|jgi:hypothetical protein
MEGNLEKKFGQVLTKEQVLEVLSSYAENSKIIKERSDEMGPYLLEVEVPGDKTGETTQYIYSRKGEFLNDDGTKNSTEVTNIQVVYCKNGIPEGGTTVANYNSESGEWENT